MIPSNYDFESVELCFVVPRVQVPNYHILSQIVTRSYVPNYWVLWTLRVWFKVLGLNRTDDYR